MRLFKITKLWVMRARRTVPPVPSSFTPDAKPEYLGPILQDIDRWALPDHDQFAHVEDKFREELNKPIAFHDRNLGTIYRQGGRVVRQFTHIAPDLVERHLYGRRVLTGHFLEEQDHTHEGGNDEARTRTTLDE